MYAEEIGRFKQNRPFRPFEIVAENGRQVSRVERHDAVGVAQAGGTVAIETANEALAVCGIDSTVMVREPAAALGYKRFQKARITSPQRELWRNVRLGSATARAAGWVCNRF